MARCAEIDRIMSKSLDPDFVQLYLSMQTEPGGNYLNLVVLQPGYVYLVMNEQTRFSIHVSSQSLSKFHPRPCQVHREAIEEISPKFFDRIMVHR